MWRVPFSIFSPGTSSLEFDLAEYRIQYSCTVARSLERSRSLAPRGCST